MINSKFSELQQYSKYNTTYNRTHQYRNNIDLYIVFHNTHSVEKFCINTFNYEWYKLYFDLAAYVVSDYISASYHPKNK